MIFASEHSHPESSVSLGRSWSDVGQPPMSHLCRGQRVFPLCDVWLCLPLCRSEPRAHLPGSTERQLHFLSLGSFLFLLARTLSCCWMAS